MKLNAIQWLWLTGVVAFVAALLADVAGVWNPANILWAALGGLLLLSGAVMPRPAQLKKTSRRG